ncbi:MAG: NFACT RNA binding domain-containing protein [Candidatus Altiarchaeota archaeon]
MEVVIDLRKSVPDNAKECYDQAKKYRGKLEGMQKAIADSKRKLESVAEEVHEQPKMRKRVERRWYEKFRWFDSSDGFLVIGGKDATSNEILIKKHLEPRDSVFHANVQGAPFFVVKNPEGKEVPQATVEQAATASASYSKAWASGRGAADVYSVRPEQISKSPPAGEYLPKGAFMVYGEKTWHKGVRLEAAVGLVGGQVIGGPKEAIAAKTKEYVILGVGDVPQGALAKKIKLKLMEAELDDIQRMMPPGEGRIV